MPDLAKRITVDPEKCGGRPCIRGMRIRVSDILNRLADGLTPERILQELPDLEAEDIRACLRFASRRLDDEISAKAKIDILLKEYETLRNEITHRINSRFAIVGFTGAIIAFTISQLKGVVWPELIWPLSVFGTTKEVAWPGSILGLAAVFLMALWRRLGTLIKRCSIRISEIEAQINNLAGQELLVWETRQRKTGIFHKL